MTKINKRIRELRNKEINREEVLQVMIARGKLRDAAFISFLYLTGMRVSEVVGGQLTHRVYHHPETNKLYKSLKNVPKEEKHKVVPYVKKVKMDGVKPSCWNRMKKLGHEFIEVNGPVLKGREYPPQYTKRIIMINESEQPFIDCIEQYMARMQQHYGPAYVDTVMFKFSRQYANRIIKESSLKVYGNKKDFWHPHLLRHKRHAILASDYFMDVAQLKAFSGWKTDNMPVHYAKQNKSDIMKRMIQSKNG